MDNTYTGSGSKATPEQIERINQLIRQADEPGFTRQMKEELDNLIYSTGYAEGRGVEA